MGPDETKSLGHVTTRIPAVPPAGTVQVAPHSTIDRNTLLEHISEVLEYG